MARCNHLLGAASHEMIDLMPSPAALIGFCVAVTPLIVTPGASFTFVTAHAITGDRRGAWATIVGTAAGILTHAMLAGAGLAALVMQSAEAFRAVRLAGACYLVALGLTMLWQSRPLPTTSEAYRAAVPKAATLTQTRRAYVANVLNVKAAAVYLTLAPQFVPAGGVGVTSMVCFATIHIAVMSAWLGAWSSSLLTVADRIDVQRWRGRSNLLGGATLVVLGGRAAREVH